MRREDIEMWRGEVEASKLLYKTRQLSAPYDSGFGFEGNTIIEGTEVLLRIVLPQSFPLELPLILLSSQKELDYVLPHVAPFEQVCFQESEGVIMDSTRPLHIIEWAINRATETIGSGIRKENLQDFVEEFEVYWEYLGGETILNFLNPTAQSGELLLVHSTKSKSKYIAEKQKDILDFWGLSKVWDKAVIHSAAYVVLPANLCITPPVPDSFWSLDEFRKIVKPAIENMPNKLRRSLFDNRKSKFGYILFALPRQSSGYSLFGVCYQSEDGTHPLANTIGNARTRLKPFTVKHFEKSYLVPRGGGSNDLSSKRVLLVGCGSIGGHVAHELVRSGVLNLCLLDHDKLALENTFRHVLGKAMFDKNKARALREELMQKYPYISVSAIDLKVEEAIKEKKIALQDFDLIIIAIGSPTIELWLNKQLYLEEREVPAVFTWLEPLGIGGHALTVRPKSEGCFKCLYTPEDEEAYLVNRASFAAPGQRFSVSLTGCNNLFTPYASLDATRTAGIAVQAGIKVLTGKTAASELISWKGETEEFLNQGFILSDRYNVSEEKLKTQKNNFAHKYCSVCGRNDAERGD